MAPRFWMYFLLMLGFIPHWILSDPPERTETVREGTSVNISFNTAERCVWLSRRADSNHTWSPPCMVCLENGPLCLELRSRVSVFSHGLTLHNVSRADEGIYNITPYLNGNRTATNIVHLVLDWQPSSTQEPPNSPKSGTTHQTGLTDSSLAGVIVGVIAGVILITWGIATIVLKKKSAQSQFQCRRRRQNSEHPAGNTVALPTLSTQPNQHQVDLAMQKQAKARPVGEGRGPGGQHVCLKA